MDRTLIDKKYNECKKLIEEAHYSKAIPLIKELIHEVSTEYLYKDKRYYSFNHILETYYYAYFLKDVSRLNYTDYNINAMYRLFGFALLKVNRLDEAIMAYNNGLDWNPVDLDTLLQLGELYKMTGNIKSLRKVSFEAYKFCCSRATLARFYRNLGYYYLESYKPEIARALYLYSNIYFETENATNELSFIADSLKDTKNDLSLKELQDILTKENIPLGPDSDTLGITYRVGQLEMDNKNYENAADCFAMVYDLTMDEEVKVLLDAASEKIENK